jgi:hypothetical protein
LAIADCGFPIRFFRYRLICNRQSQIGNSLRLRDPFALTPKSFLQLSESPGNLFLREVSASFDDLFAAHDNILHR